MAWSCCSDHGAPLRARPTRVALGSPVVDTQDEVTMRKPMIGIAAAGLVVASVAQTAVVFGAPTDPWAHLADLATLIALCGVSAALLLGQRMLLKSTKYTNAIVSEMLAADGPLVGAIDAAARGSAASVTWSIEARLLEFLERPQDGS